MYVVPPLLYPFVYQWTPIADCFHILATLNNTMINKGYIYAYLFELVFSLSLDKYWRNVLVLQVSKLEDKNQGCELEFNPTTWQLELPKDI